MTHVTEKTLRILANVIPGHSAYKAAQKETFHIMRDAELSTDRFHIDLFHLAVCNSGGYIGRKKNIQRSEKFLRLKPNIRYCNHKPRQNCHTFQC
jgi:hypothetical protein